MDAKTDTSGCDEHRTSSGGIMVSPSAKVRRDRSCYMHRESRLDGWVSTSPVTASPPLSGQAEESERCPA